MRNTFKISSSSVQRAPPKPNNLLNIPPTKPPQNHRQHGYVNVRRAAHSRAAHAKASSQGIRRRFRRPRRALLHLLRRRLHLKVPLLQGNRLPQPLRPQVDGHPAARQRALPGAQRPDYAADAEIKDMQQTQLKNVKTTCSTTQKSLLSMTGLTEGGF